MGRGGFVGVDRPTRGWGKDLSESWIPAAERGLFSRIVIKSVFVELNSTVMIYHNDWHLFEYHVNCCVNRFYVMLWNSQAM